MNLTETKVIEIGSLKIKDRNPPVLEQILMRIVILVPGIFEILFGL